MAIAIENSEQLRRLLVALADELVDANIFWRMHNDLELAAGAFPIEVNQAWTFWSRTLQAHGDAAVFRLCKIYDQHRDGLHLRSLLETIQANASVFSEANFRERLKGNPFVDSLAVGALAPDPVQLATDLAYASKSNPKVELLVGLRNKFYAHRASREVLTAVNFAAEYPLLKTDVTDLLRTGLAIVNRYSTLFQAQSYSPQIIGHDDYRTVIEAVRWDLDRREADIHRTDVRVGLQTVWNDLEAKRREARQA